MVEMVPSQGEQFRQGRRQANMGLESSWTSGWKQFRFGTGNSLR